MSASLSELLARRKELQAQIEVARQAELSTALGEIARIVEQYGIKRAQLLTVLTRKSKHAKYRDPVTGTTWSGRGRAPAWLAHKDRREFLITRQDAASAAAADASAGEQQVA